MKRNRIQLMVVVGLFLSAVATLVLAEQDKYTLQVPNGLAFAEFKGYEDWQAVAPTQTDAQNVTRLILANPVMIAAYKEGVPGNECWRDAAVESVSGLSSLPSMLRSRQNEECCRETSSHKALRVEQKGIIRSYCNS